MTLSVLSWRPVTAVAAILVLAACNTTGGGGTTASASASASVAASPSASEGAAESYEIKVATTSAGPTLTGEDGKTLYVFTKDSTGKSACNADCATTWPPFTVEGDEKATAGEGVNAAWIGTLTRADGKTQVSYNGRPLYYFSGDKAAGDANGEGIGGIWFVATPDGSLPSASSASAGASASASYGYR